MQKSYFSRLQQCFSSESIELRSRTLTSLTETTCQQRIWLLCVTRSLNVLASGVSVYVLAFVMEADILRTCCNKDDMMWHVWLFETVTASRVCRYSVNYSNVHLIIALAAQSVWIRHFEFPSPYSAGEVSTLCSYLLRVYSWAFLPIFIEISSCLTDPE